MFRVGMLMLVLHVRIYVVCLRISLKEASMYTVRRFSTVELYVAVQEGFIK